MVKKTIAAFFTVLVLSSALTACNTTRGVGQDISEAAAQSLAQQPKLSNNSLRRYGFAPYRSSLPHSVGYTHYDFSSTLRDDP
jgi:entericidin B